MTDDEMVQAITAVVDEDRFKAPPATGDMVDAAEAAIGFTLPPLLRRLYTEVANGGFGPCGGVLGVPGGRRSSGNFADIVDAYTELNVELPPDHEYYYPIPPGMLWLLDEGCAMWSLIDLNEPSGPVWGWDPGGEPMLFRRGLTLADWLTAWLDAGAPAWAR